MGGRPHKEMTWAEILSLWKDSGGPNRFLNSYNRIQAGR